MRNSSSVVVMSELPDPIGGGMAGTAKGMTPLNAVPNPLVYTKKMPRRDQRPATSPLLISF